MAKLAYIIALFGILCLPVTSSAQTPEIGNKNSEIGVLNDDGNIPPWQVCNQTSYILHIANLITPKGMEESSARVKGWQKLMPGACTTILAEQNTPRFVYAKSDPVHIGPMREWKGKHQYCISDGDFIARTDMSCALQNLKPANFLKVIPTETKTTFIEADNFKSKAAIAGMQRLLQDNGYDIKRVDGRDGQRTRKTLNKFLKDKGLKKSLSFDEKLLALEQAARNKQKDIGLTFCNQTNSPIFTAIAYDTKKHWRSFGWWKIEPMTCVHPFHYNLKNVETYYYARKETGKTEQKILKTNTGNVREFCVAASTFSAIKQEYCEDRGYAAARFIGLGQDQSGQTIKFTEENFSRPEISGLR